MTLYPDTSTDSRKEEILSRSPFTKAFLWEGVPYDTANWLANLTPEEQRLNGELVGILGERWEIICMNPLVITTVSTHIFDPKLPQEALYLVTKSLVEMGYEIENTEEVGLLLPQIIRQLGKIGAFNKEAIRFKSQTANTLVETLFGLLSVGVYFRGLGSGNNSDVPDVFKKFIESLGDWENG